MTRTLAAAVAALAFTLSCPASHAGEPGSPEAAAETLHTRALEAMKAEHRAAAISLWLQAHNFHPFWKYAYNLANAYYLERDFLAAWQWLSEAKRTMKEHLDKLGTLEASVRVELGKTHAWLDIEVLPADAVVTRDGEPWLAPRELWTTATSTRVAVEAPGYEPLVKELSFVPGARVVETLVLVPLRRGELVVTGTPAGATVAVRPVHDEGAPAEHVAPPVTVGTLPRVSVVLPPGRYEVTIDDPDFVPRVATVAVDDNGTFELPIALRARPRPSAGLDGRQTAGLVTAGVGVAAGIAGAFLLAAADDKAQAMDRLNGDAAHLRTLDYDGYLAEYDGLKKDKELYELGGIIALGAGAAAVVTGVVLVLTGGDPVPETKGRVDVRVGALPGGGRSWSGSGSEGGRFGASGSRCAALR